jgi:hypothetical protein
LHRLPAVTNLLQVGKWFWSDFLAIFIADFSSSHLAVLHRPPSRQKTTTAGFYMRRVHPPTRSQAGTRLLHPWLPSRLARSSPVSPRFSEREKILRSIAPQLHPCSPAPPPSTDTHGGTASQVRDGDLPSNSENDANQLIS